jgi:hypothetical protein
MMLLAFLALLPGCHRLPAGEYESPSGDDWIAVEAGVARFTCGLHATGDVECWGSESGAWRVMAHSFEDGAVDLATGDDDLCAIHPGGVLDCSDPSLEGLELPGELRDLGVGVGDACAVTTTGELSCLGATDLTAGPQTGTYTAVALDRSNDPCALRDDGEVECLTAPGLWSPPAGPFTDLDASDGFCAAGEAGTWCWTTGEPAEQVRGPSLAVDVGLELGCALDADGAPDCWFHEYAPGFPRLKAPLPRPRYEQITAGQYQVCGLADGTIDCVEVCFEDLHHPNCP